MRRTDLLYGALRRGHAIALGLALLWVAPAARAQLIPSINQMSFTLDGVSAPYQFSEWGDVAVTYTPTSVEQYFNLNVNGMWVVQNMPVVTREGVGIQQTDNFQFNLGAALGYARGTSRVGQNVPIGYTMTPAPASSPGIFGSLSVASELNVMGSGAGEGSALLNAAAGAAAGGAAASPGKSNRNFPNQECGFKECAPASVSNSLQFLKAQNPGANWGSLPIDIATMKTATNWNAAYGNWIDPNPNRPAGQRNAWWQDKNNYMINNGYPVMTMRTLSFDDILMAIMNGKDVELQGDWHTAAVVGITDLGGGSYSLQVAQDTDQGPLPGHAGGTRVDTIRYNPDTARFEGSPAFFDGSSFRYAVIEMVPAPGSIGLLGLAGIAAARRRRRS